MRGGTALNCFCVPSLCRGHLSASFCAVAEDIGAHLTVVRVVTLTLFSALLTRSSAGFCEFFAVVGVSCHEPRVEAREVGDVSTEAGALRHLFVADTLVRTPFTHLSGGQAVVDTLLHLSVDVVDLS